MTIARQAESVSHLELRALEKMVRVLCEYIARAARQADERGSCESREADLQLQVFLERRNEAKRVLHTDTTETQETRIARLEKIVESLDCSRAYFRPADTDDDGTQWAIRVG